MASLSDTIMRRRSS